MHLTLGFFAESQERRHPQNPHAHPLSHSSIPSLLAAPWALRRQKLCLFISKKNKIRKIKAIKAICVARLLPRRL